MIRFNDVSESIFVCVDKNDENRIYRSKPVYITDPYCMIDKEVPVFYHNGGPDDYSVDLTEYGISHLPLNVPLIVCLIFLVVGVIFTSVGLYMLIHDLIRGYGFFLGPFFTIFGSIFILIPLLIYFVGMKDYRTERSQIKLMKNTIRTKAKIVNVRYRYSYPYNGLNSCRFVLQAEDGNKIIRFKSDSFYHSDPKSFIGQKVPAIVFKTKPRASKADLSELFSPAHMGIETSIWRVFGITFNVIALYGVIVLLFGFIGNFVAKDGFAGDFALLIGFTLLIFGAVPHLIHFIIKGKGARLRKRGKRVYAVVEEYLDNSEGSDACFVIRARAKDSNQTFESDRIYRDVDKNSIIGRDVTVYVSKNNPNEYLIDIFEVI